MDRSETEVKERKKREEVFHDHAAEDQARLIVGKFYAGSVAESTYRHCLAALGELKGKRFLEYGCGQGWQLNRFASRGARVTGVDISLASLIKASERMDQLGLKKLVNLCEMDGENLGFKDSSFELVFGTGVLHHLDIRSSAKEVARILQKGGRAAFVEPLGMNPLINLFRRVTPKLRTPDEHPLTFKDIDTLSEFFTTVDHKEFYLVSLLSYFFRFILRSETLFKKSFVMLEGVDHFLLSTIPLLRRYCWATVITVTK